MQYLNRMYDSLRTEHAWRFLSDNYASGTIATTVNATAFTNVVLGLVPNRLLQQWPKAAAVYPLIRFFGVAPQTVPAANGGIECFFIDASGNSTPLGEFLSQVGGNNPLSVLLNAPITDPSSTAIGQLSVKCSNVANANGTYNYSFGFSFAYLLPEDIHEYSFQDASAGMPTIPVRPGYIAPQPLAARSLQSAQGLADLPDLARRR